MPLLSERRVVVGVQLAVLAAMVAVVFVVSAPTRGHAAVSQPGGAQPPVSRTTTAAGAAGPGISQPVGNPAAAGGSGASDAAGAAAPGQPADYRAPVLVHPLANLDPGLATRGPRPTLSRLMQYQYGNPAPIVQPGATPLQWQLSRPNAGAVRGYADQISVLPGQDLGLHLSGWDRSARLDVFRMGVRDGQHLLTIDSVPVGFRAGAPARPADGLVDESWPVSTTLHVPGWWRSGVYLVKLTGDSGGQSYILFVVRSAAPQPLMVVLPTMTYEAYNDYGGSDLYGWYGGPLRRAYRVSFDRPFNSGYGAGFFFRLDFPLIVWLEDHGYAPGYVTDVDLATSPGLLAGVRTLAFSGHGEYWTGSIRDAVGAAQAQGTNLAFFGANQAFWQVRLEPDGAGSPNRVIVCYKSASLDPLAASTPADATVRFQDPPVDRSPAQVMGLQYGGVVTGIRPLVVGPAITTFDPSAGLPPGEALPGLIADEVDQATQPFSGALLGSTPLTVTEHPGTVDAAAALWTAPGGARVFDAGTFDFSWGLDPRYSAALPGFPGRAWTDLTAGILAWLGAQPVR